MVDNPGGKFHQYKQRGHGKKDLFLEGHGINKI